MRSSKQASRLLIFEMKQNKKYGSNIAYTDHQNNAAEAEFVAKAEKHGLIPLSKGWPDFLCYNPEDGSIICAEVKPTPNQRLKYHQYLMMKLLTLAGIECYHYTPQKGLVPFEVTNADVGADLVFKEREKEREYLCSLPDVTQDNSD